MIGLRMADKNQIDSPIPKRYLFPKASKKLLLARTGIDKRLK
jgi:hypothetical protein